MGECVCVFSFFASPLGLEFSRERELKIDFLGDIEIPSYHRLVLLQSHAGSDRDLLLSLCLISLIRKKLNYILGISHYTI